MNRIISYSIIIILLVSFASAMFPVTASAQDVVILQDRYYVDGSGYSTVVGEVQNQGTESVEYVIITVTFYDTSDTVLATDFTYTLIDILLPNQISPFEVNSYPQTGLAVDSYALAVEWDIATDVPYREFTIQGINTYLDNDYFHIIGEVVNDGSISAAYVKILGTFYFTNDTIITFDLDYIDPDPLPGGSSGPFDLSTYPMKLMPASYALDVDCGVVLPESSITCLAASSINLGSDITIMGAITPPRSSVPVDVLYTMPNDTVITQRVTTNFNGEYTDTYTPSVSGDWTVEARWYGGSIYSGAESSLKFFDVSGQLLPVSITCQLSTNQIEFGDSVIISGSITPAISVEIFLAWKIADWEGIAFVDSDTSGHFSHIWVPSMITEYEVAAYFDGDGTYDRGVSNILLLDVTKYASTLTCIAASTSIAQGQAVTISGALDPILSGETITLRYQPPSGSVITRTVTTDSSGEYSDTYSPSTTGSWSVTASWEGNATHSDVSASRSFTVGGSGCLVATATFGSELTPQVQFLRSFRDHRVLSTYAGSQFMEVFNSFYYSWSPNVANTIRTSDGFSNIMKVVLYPLIGVLQVSEGIFSVMSSSPELAVITAGFAASSLLASIYLVPLGLVISHLTKYRPPKQLIYAIGIIWLASLIAISIAEFTQTSVVMMTATGTFVLATISVTLLIAIQQMPALITAIRSLRPRLFLS